MGDGYIGGLAQDAPAKSGKGCKVLVAVFATLFVVATALAVVFALDKKDCSITSEGTVVSDNGTESADGIVWKQYTTFGGYAFDYPADWGIEVKNTIDDSGSQPNYGNSVAIVAPSGVELKYVEWLPPAMGWGPAPIFSATVGQKVATAVLGVSVAWFNDLVGEPWNDTGTEMLGEGSVSRTILRLTDSDFAEGSRINDLRVDMGFIGSLSPSLGSDQLGVSFDDRAFLVGFGSIEAQDFTPEEFAIAVKILASFRKF